VRVTKSTLTARITALETELSSRPTREALESIQRELDRARCKLFNADGVIQKQSAALQEEYKLRYGKDAYQEVFRNAKAALEQLANRRDPVVDALSKTLENVTAPKPAPAPPVPYFNIMPVR
jgi:hypothetical protein